MNLNHDQQSIIVTDEIFKKWKQKESSWKNKFIEDDIQIVAGQLNFPSPDRSFYSSKIKSRIAIEFKPIGNHREDIIKGLGQVVTYLNKNSNSASYLVCANFTPEKFKIGDFLETLFKKTIYQKLPIGLITYNPKNIKEIKLRCNISNDFKIGEVKEKGVDRSFWADYRDSYLEANYYLIKIANEIPFNVSNRSKVIWDIFYEDYLCAVEASKTLALVNSKIKDENGKFQVPLEDTKAKLKKLVKKNEISKEDALKRLSKEVSDNVSDNHYQDLKKNHNNFLSHLKLWDNTSKIPTSIGLRFLKKVKNKKNILLELSKVVLGSGKYKELIDNINSFLSENKKNYISENERRVALKAYFQERGFVKQNPERSTTKSRNYLQSEFQLMFKLGFKRKFKNGTRHYDDRYSYGFKMDKINLLYKSFIKEYPKE